MAYSLGYALGRRVKLGRESPPKTFLTGTPQARAYMEGYMDAIRGR